MNKAEYPKCELGDLIHIKHGYAFKSKYFTSIGKQIVLTPGNFFEFGGFKARPGKDRFYVGEYPEDYLLDRDDLIVAMTEQGEGLLGSAALVPASSQYLHNQRIGLVSIRNPSQVNKKFLYYLFNTSLVRQQIRNSSSGTKVRHTSPERMYRVQVKAPDLTIQKKIAAVLSAYDDLIENNNRRIALLEKMAEEIYREWFVRLRFPGHEEVAFHKGIPEGWKSKNIGAGCYVGDGAHASIKRVQDGIPYLTTKNFKSEGLDFSKIDYISVQDYQKYFGGENKSIKTPQQGDVLMGIIGSFGKPYLVDSSDEFGLSSSVAILRPKSEVLVSEYLYSWTRSASFMEAIHSIKSGSAQGFLSLKMIASLPLLLPPVELQKYFADTVKPIARSIGLLMSRATLLSQTRDRLLTRLISGKLSVEDLDIQFPPSMTTDT